MVKEDYSFLWELEFVKLDASHSKILERFQTWQEDLRDFLLEDALRTQNSMVNTTLLAFDQKEYYEHGGNMDKLNLLGYVTIMNDSINLSGSLKEVFKQKEIHYKALPALKICRLCVDDRYHMRHIGKLLVLECVRRVGLINSTVSGCRFLVLDAKRSATKTKDSMHFYRKMGFDVMEHKERTKAEMMRDTHGTTPMYWDLFHILAKVEPDKKLEIVPAPPSINEKKSTVPKPL